VFGTQWPGQLRSSAHSDSVVVCAVCSCYRGQYSGRPMAQESLTVQQNCGTNLAIRTIFNL
jgi:hypothetical protein